MKWSISSKIIDEAHQLVNDERIIKLVPDETETVWRSEVVDDKTYKVILDGTAKEEDVCQCDVWEKKGYCRHTVATELFLRELDMTRVFKFNNELKRFPETADEDALMTVLMEEFKQDILGEPDETIEAPQLSPLNIVVEVQNEGTQYYQTDFSNIFYLRLKIGYHRQYYVSDLSEFFNCLENHGLYTLPNRERETIWLSPVTFSKATYEFLSQLAQSYMFDREKHMKSLHTPDSRHLKQRYYLNREQIQTLLTYHEDTPFELQWLIDNESVHFNRQQPSNFLTISKQNQKIIFKFNPNIHWFKHYGIVAINQEVYQVGLTKQDFQAMNALYNQIVEHQFELEIDIDQAKELIMNFGYLFRKIQPEINFAEIVNIQQEKLVTELIADLTQQTLQVELIHHYGTQVAYRPHQLTISDEDPIILRDVTTEIKRERWMNRLHFSYENNHYSQKFPSVTEAVHFIKKLTHSLPHGWQWTFKDKLAGLDEHELNGELELNRGTTNRYLTINFNIEDVESQEVDRILEAIVNRETYYQLSDGRIVDVSNVLPEEQEELVQHLYQQNGEVKSGDKIPIYQTLRFASELQDQADFQRFYDEIIHYNDYIDVDLAGLKTTLSHYQLEAVKWLKALSRYQLGGLLADEMGLGKTVQTIGYVLDAWNSNQKLKCLIITPASVLYNWKHEFNRFAPKIPVTVIDGSIEERETLRENAGNIMLTSYQSYRNDQEAYKDDFFDVLILDEAQAIKNERTLLYQSVAKQKAGMRIGLSGTPLENNLSEFWAMMRIILPGLLPDAKTFQNLSTSDIRQLTAPFVLRRTKQDVQLDLPDKEVSDRYASLDAKQKNIYLAYLEDIKNKMDQASQLSNIQMDLLAGITRLRQICCHPQLIDSDYSGTSGKFEYFKETLGRALDAGKSVLVFSQFTSMLDIIGNYLEDQSIAYYKITGQTKKQVRQEQVTAFNRQERQVFLISLRAGGVGLNLTGADTVFLYDLWWNPAVEEQAIGRAHRIGQTNDVRVYRFITEGTIEQRIAELQEEKRILFDEVFTEGESGINQSLSLEDLQQIIGIKN